MTDDGKTPVLARTRLGLNAARKLLGSPMVLVPTPGTEPQSATQKIHGSELPWLGD